MVPLKATCYRPHALHIFVKRVHLFIEPRLLRLPIGAAQLIECLTDGEFVYFCHCKILDRGNRRKTAVNWHSPALVSDDWGSFRRPDPR